MLLYREFIPGLVAAAHDVVSRGEVEKLHDDMEILSPVHAAARPAGSAGRGQRLRGDPREARWRGPWHIVPEGGDRAVWPPVARGEALDREADSVRRPLHDVTDEPVGLFQSPVRRRPDQRRRLFAGGVHRRRGGYGEPGSRDGDLVEIERDWPDLIS